MGHELVSSTTTPPVSKPRAASPTALAPGFRFHPTDEELVIYYLKRKVCRKPFKFNAISDVDIYKSEPWDLACKSSLKSRDQEYYFFSALDKKYGNGARMNRATNLGYWKATGNDRPVKHNDKTVGMKKTLVFHSGRAPDGKRTNWVMHEYRLVDTEIEKPGSCVPQDAYVLCRVFHKSNIGPPNGHRYAPFVEEEWDDEKLTFVPGEEARDDTIAVRDSVGENQGNVVMVGNGHDSLVNGIRHDVLMIGNGHDSLVGGNRHDVVLGNSHGLVAGENCHDVVLVRNGHSSVVEGAIRDALVIPNGRDALSIGNGHDALAPGNCRDAAVGENGHTAVAQNDHASVCNEKKIYTATGIQQKHVAAGSQQNYSGAAAIEQVDNASATILQNDDAGVSIQQRVNAAASMQQKNNAAADIEEKNHVAFYGGNSHGPSFDGHGQVTMMEVDGHGSAEEGNLSKSTEKNGHDGRCAGNYFVQDTQTISNALLSATELPKEDKNGLLPCKTERVDDDPMTCVINREQRLDDYPSPLEDDPQPLLSLFNQQPGILRQYKRRRHNESHSNRSNMSEISSGLTHDPCSSTTTTASTETSVTATTKRNFLSALVEFQLLESIEPKDKTPVAPPEFNAAMHSSSVPSSCLKFIESLQNEIHKISIEKETLKFEMLSAQAVINILQSRIDLLNKENEELKRNAQEAG